MKTVTAPELAHWLADGSRARPLLLDVREPWEFERCHLADSALMPMRDLPARLDEIAADVPVVCICHHGGRSAHAAMFLARQGVAEVYNLTGGVDSWARHVDPRMPTY